MEQKININGSQNVTINQAGGDIYQAGKAVKLSSGQREELTKRYLDFIASRYSAIPCLSLDVSLTMENYIPLQLGEERKEERQRKGKDEEPKEAGDIDFRVWREEHSFGEVHSLTPVDVWRAIQNKKLVVKGDPGAGKTTLTRYIAFWSASTMSMHAVSRTLHSTHYSTHPIDLIPLIIDLKDWAGKLEIPFPEYYAKSTFLRLSGLEKEIEPLIIDWLKSGKCIILCDGLDEVTQQNKESVISSLQNLTSGEYRNCHLLVTTRIVGYANELSGWKHYEVMPLKKENIEQYAGDYLKDKSSSARGATSFLSALKNTPQMEPLSKNPLLLQILCFVFDKHKLVLPAGRVELYEKAVSEMLKRRNPKIPSSVKKKVLQKIAFSFLEQGKEVFEEWELTKTIAGFLKAEELNYNVDDVLKEIVEGSGLLCRFGDGRYIFLHLTFEEYFCACYIVGQASCLSFLEPVLFNPRFREVVRLTAGMLPKDERLKPELRRTDGINSLEFQSLGFQPTVWNFIKFILDQKPLCYDILHQPLLLAGLCIADIPDDNADPSLEEEILYELWRLWNETTFSTSREEINRVFAAMAGGRYGEEIINNLLGQLKNKDSWAVRGYAASVLGKLGQADKRVIDELLGRLEDEYSWVRECAVSALGKLGQVNKVIDELLGRLEDKDSLWYWRATSLLGELGQADDRVIDSLLEQLKDKSERVRRYVAEALGKLGQVDDRVIDGLLGLLQDEDLRVCWSASEALSKLGCANDKVIDALIDRLESENSHMRVYAASVLGNLGQGDKRVIDGLLDRLEDEDSGVRRYAAIALGKLGQADKRVIDALINRLGEKSSGVRSEAASALGKLGQADKKVIDTLLGGLKDKDFEVQGHAAFALGKLGYADDRVIDGLFGRLKDKDSGVRRSAASALGNLGRADIKVIDGLLELLKDEDSGMRKYAAKSLGNLGRADDKVIDGLLVLLEDKDGDVRNAAYSSLQRLAEKQAREKSARLPSPISQVSVDTFFQQNQDTIKELAQKFSTYQNRTTSITEEAIKDWLFQFDNLSWMKLALKLLERIDYYTPQRMKEMFRHFYEQIIPEEDRPKVVVSLLGDLKDSATIVNYILGEVFMEYGLKAQPLEVILNNMKPEEKVIVFVDDNIGSGKQAVRIFGEWLGIEKEILKEHHVERLSKTQQEKFKGFKLYLCTFVGFEEGKERVSNELKEMGLNIGKIYSFKKEEEAIGCFHPASNIFANPEDLKKAKEMAKDIGIQLFKDKNWPEELKAERSLGYGNSQKLIIFFYNTPTSTLPILWKEGIYEGRSWQPLFPRRQKR